MKWFKHIVLLLVMTVTVWSAVSLEIQNADTDAGTLDIYMSNLSHCEYWEESNLVIDENMSETDCGSNIGEWFNGEVGGFQFELIGITITDATAPTGFIVSTSASTVLAFSLTGATIPPGEGILTQVSFNNFEGESICFGDDTGSSGGTAISDGDANYLAANWGDCYCESYTDCTGECGGTAIEDECGVCNGSGIIDGDCDCFGNTLDECDICGGDNSTCADCADIPNGDNVEDNCDICDNDSENDCIQDCFGVWGGTAELDECFVCGGDGPPEGFDCDGNCTENCDYDCFDVFQGTGKFDDCDTCIDCSQYEDDCSLHPAWNQSCIDCTNELNGNAFIDTCGSCVAGSTGSPACIFDCGGLNPGDPNWTGVGSIDNCGECDANSDNDCEIDCNGDWGGTALIDNCGLCYDGEIGEEACSQDCNGDWGGTAEVDDCNVCGGANSCHDCAGIPNGNAVIDNCDTCDSDFSNDCVPDCNGDWGGPDNISDTGDEATIDECGICGGDGISEGACDCNDNVVDECGVCGGSNSCFDCANIPNGNNVEDNCGTCDNDSSNNCTPDCNGTWGGEAEFDNCGTCDNDTENDCTQDCYGAWGGDAEFDECGVCGGSGMPDGACDCDSNVDLGCGCGEDAPTGCDNVCGSNLEFDECGVCGGSSIPNGDCDCNGNIDLGCGCGEAGPSGCDNACGSTLEFDNCGVCGGDNTSCSWTELTAAVEEINQIALSWDAVDSRSGGRNSSGNRNSDCSSGVCLSIENVDTDAGTLDIYMSNQAGCSYCTDPLYDNRNLCELFGNDGSGYASWVFDSSMTETDCGNVGQWFNGEVGGFSFQLFGATIDGASGGSAESNGFTISVQAATYNPETDTQLPNILAFSLTGAAIPAGEGVLVSVSFSNFEGPNICFGESELANSFSDSEASSLSTVWGECACPAGLDECGVCAGSGIADGDCDCYGNVEDECGECGGNNSTCADCANVPNGDSVLDNCGTCDNDPNNDCDMDCTGEWGGSLVNDECGECGGDGLGNGSYYMDCWDGIEYCSNNGCPIDPNAVSYKIYRNGLGIAIAEVQGETRFTDLDLGYNEQYCYTVTFVNDGVESQHSIQACAITDEMPIVEGCMSTYACNYDESATVDDDSCWFANTGCSCEAGQGAMADNCGVCDIDSSNNCIPDCNGEWGGSLISDECGVCGGSGIAEGQCDCNGNSLDECGVCGGDDSTCNTSSDVDCDPEIEGNQNYDCSGICNGGATIDSCGLCTGGGTSLTPDYLKDCAGVCGGSSVIDECDICGGDGSSCSTEDDLPWTELIAAGGDNQISLSWTNPDGESSGSDSDDGSPNNSSVYLEIQNVDTEAGTLDIYMSNLRGCSYCEDPTYNNNTASWTSKKEYCEGIGNSTWIFNTSITEEECGSIPSITEAGGWWFNGEVGGFQFELLGVTITAATAPDGLMASISATTVLAFSLTGATIPPGSGILTQVTFTDFEGSGICFGEDTGSSGNTAISDGDGGYIGADWGDCFCALEIDECGVCGGNGIPEDTCDCDGNIAEFECWNGSLACDASECPVNSDDYSYNVYRDGVPFANGIVITNFTDSGLDASESHCYTITFSKEGEESEPTLETCAATNSLAGCMDESACNYNPDASISNGSCWHAGLGCECSNGQGAESDNCGECDLDPTNDCTPDCNGEWGGGLVIDECGVCGGTGPDLNFDCDGNCLTDYDCAGDCAGDLLGSGIFECINGFAIDDSLGCVTIGNTWVQIGNDECGECGGDGTNCLSLYFGLIPEEYSINNVYPNPFNPVTNIEFGLPENAFVQIIVYDIKGRQIATLMNSFQFAGYYSLLWEASNQPSGVYFIDMTSDGFKQTRQVVLMK